MYHGVLYLHFQYAIGCCRVVVNGSVANVRYTWVCHEREGRNVDSWTGPFLLGVQPITRQVWQTLWLYIHFEDV